MRLKRSPEQSFFIQVYRLLSVYSLIKPPKGSNISEVEIFETLLQAKETNVNPDKRKWSDSVDEVIDKGFCSNFENFDFSKKDHNYGVTYSSDFVVTFVSGFLCKKILSWTSCELCISTVLKAASDKTEREKMIDLLNKGKLKYPTEDLFQTIKSIENTVMEFASSENLNAYTLFDIVQHIDISKCGKLGCVEHADVLTRQIIIKFLTMCGDFIAKAYNRINNEKRELTRKRRKLSKL